MLHATVITSHRGVFKMFPEAITHAWWLFLFNDNDDYVASCKLFAEMKPLYLMVHLKIPDGLFHAIHLVLLRFHTLSRRFNYVLNNDAFQSLWLQKH